MNSRGPPYLANNFGFRASPAYPSNSFNQYPGSASQFHTFQASNPQFFQRNPQTTPGVDAFRDSSAFLGEMPSVDSESTVYLLDQEFLKFQNFSFTQAIQTLFAYFFVFSTSKLFKNAIKPFRRGFFCDDQSISYPYQQSTVSAALVYVIGYSCNVAAIVAVEWVLVYFYWRPPRGSKCMRSLLYKTSFFFYSLVSSTLPFMFGGIMSMAITDVGKFTIGRLRPHFLSVCQPNWNYINCSAGFVTHDVCTGDPSAIRDARLSFPSGHSSLAFFCATFLVLYLHKRASVIRPVQLVTPVISLAALILALFTALSRVSDNKHHPTDVLAGSLVGILSASYAVYLTPVFRQLPPSPKQPDVRSTLECSQSEDE